MLRHCFVQKSRLKLDYQLFIALIGGEHGLMQEPWIVK